MSNLDGMWFKVAMLTESPVTELREVLSSSITMEWVKLR